MDEDMEAVWADCPDCGPEDHQILRARSSTVTLQCLACERVHKVAAPSGKTVDLRVVVSHGDESHKSILETERDELIAVGDEFWFEEHRMIVTAIESPAERRVKSCTAADIHVLYAKHFDTVILNLSLNDGDQTTSYQQILDPDEEVHVGVVREVDGVLMAPKTLKSDMNRTLHKGFLLARNVRRVFCDPAPAGVDVGQAVRTRIRGKQDDAPRKSNAPAGFRAGGKPAAKPAFKTAGKTAGKPGAKPGAKAGSKPAGKPGGRPGTPRRK